MTIAALAGALLSQFHDRTLSTLTVAIALTGFLSSLSWAGAPHEPDSSHLSDPLVTMQSILSSRRNTLLQPLAGGASMTSMRNTNVMLLALSVLFG